MITTKFYKDKKSRLVGFTFDGHAEFADPGEDVVCAAVSTVVYATENAIDKLTKVKYSCGFKDGYVDLRVDTKCLRGRHDVQLLLRMLELSIIDIKNKYGEDYITISYEEV